jgi:hypothetical protein
LCRLACRIPSAKNYGAVIGTALTIINANRCFCLEVELKWQVSHSRWLAEEEPAAAPR